MKISKRKLNKIIKENILSEQEFVVDSGNEDDFEFVGPPSWPGGIDRPFHSPILNGRITRLPNSGHSGIDWGVPVGSPYYAVYDGVVTKVVGGVDDEWSQNYRWYFRKSGFGAGENNIVYQAFPGLRIHVSVKNDPEGYNLFSGPKGLEKFWDGKNFTGSYQDVVNIINSLPNIVNKKAYIAAAKPTTERTIGNKYGHSGLEHAKGGNSITLEIDDPAGGKTVLYCAHMESADVSVGESVLRGQVLGKVGKSGRITGPHVHLAIKEYKGQKGTSTSKSKAIDFLNRVYTED